MGPYLVVMVEGEDRVPLRLFIGDKAAGDACEFCSEILLGCQKNWRFKEFEIVLFNDVGIPATVAIGTPIGGDDDEAFVGVEWAASLSYLQQFEGLVEYGGLLPFLEQKQ